MVMLFCPLEGRGCLFVYLAVPALSAVMADSSPERLFTHTIITSNTHCGLGGFIGFFHIKFLFDLINIIPVTITVTRTAVGQQ